MSEQENILREAVLEELAQRKKALGEGGQELLFNNFKSRILDKNHPSGGYGRHKTIKVGCMDQPMHNKSESNAALHSEKAFITTWRDYYKNIDEIAERLGLQDKLQELIDIYKGRNTGMTKQQAYKAINELLEPVYVELRLMGFSDYDLIQ